MDLGLAVVYLVIVGEYLEMVVAVVIYGAGESALLSACRRLLS